MYRTEIIKFVLPGGRQGTSGSSTPPSPLSAESPVSPWSRKLYGRTRLCSGYEVQESNNMYLVNAWEAPTPETDVPALSEEPADLGSVPNSPVANLDYRIRVQFAVEPYTALSAPVTEIVVWTLREGASRATVEQLLTALMKTVSSIPASEGLYKAGWGSVLDNEEQFVVLIGWENMEAFHSAVKNSPEGRALLDELDIHTSRQIRHATLRADLI